MTSEVTELIAALRSGHMTLDEVAQRFRERAWPDSATPEPKSYQEMAARALQDPDPYLPGSFDDVSAALHRKELTFDEYEVLAQAATEGMSAKARRSSDGSQPATGS